MFKRNVGGFDRCARLMVGMVLVMVGFFLLGGIRGELAGLVVGSVGLVALVTGLLGFCPLYVPLGITTAGGAGPAMCAMAGCCGGMRRGQEPGRAADASKASPIG